jgi:PPOX class probable F420-dependent enzyme
MPDSARAVIESGRLAHFVTINRDGSPHVTIVWVGIDDDDIVIGKLAHDRKLANIARDPRVSLSIEAEGDQFGMQNYLVVEGTARVQQGGGPELLHDLAQRYIGPGTVFPPMPDPPPGFVIPDHAGEGAGHGPMGHRVGLTPGGPPCSALSVRWWRAGVGIRPQDGGHSARGLPISHS